MTSHDLIAEYRRTRYLVLDGEGTALAEVRIGELAADVDRLLAAHASTSGVFVTAWNPLSEPTDPVVNEQAHHRLLADVAARGLVALPHDGVGADPSWTEHGLLVIGLGERDGVALATAYGQHAVVVVETGRPARLVLTPLMG